MANAQRIQKHVMHFYCPESCSRSSHPHIAHSIFPVCTFKQQSTEIRLDIHYHTSLRSHAAGLTKGHYTESISAERVSFCSVLVRRKTVRLQVLYRLLSIYLGVLTSGAELPFEAEIAAA